MIRGGGFSELYVVVLILDRLNLCLGISFYFYFLVCKTYGDDALDM